MNPEKKIQNAGPSPSAFSEKNPERSVVSFLYVSVLWGFSPDKAFTVKARQNGGACRTWIAGTHDGKKDRLVDDPDLNDHSSWSVASRPSFRFGRVEDRA